MNPSLINFCCLEQRPIYHSLKLIWCSKQLRIYLESNSFIFTFQSHPISAVASGALRVLGPHWVLLDLQNWNYKYLNQDIFVYCLNKSWKSPSLNTFRWGNPDWGQSILTFNKTQRNTNSSKDSSEEICAEERIEYKNYIRLFPPLYLILATKPLEKSPKRTLSCAILWW